MDFVKAVAERQRNIIVVEDVNKLEEMLETYEEITAHMQNTLQHNNEKFCAEFGKIANELVR